MRQSLRMSLGSRKLFPMIRMIGMIVVFLGIVIGDLVFFLRVIQAKSIKQVKLVFVRV